MNPNPFRPRLSFFSAILASLLISGASARTWTSSDGSKTFEGDLKSYDEASGMVVVAVHGGTTMSFKQDVLSADDVTWLKTEGKNAAPKPPSGGGAAAISGDLPKIFPTPDGQEADMSKPVQVYILMGQSNMLGLGSIGSLEEVVKTNKKFPYMLDEAGDWSIRKDVRNVFVMSGTLQHNDWMCVTNRDHVGPEYGIGHALGTAIEAPVMILKSCIGNRSLGWDLLPPGSEPYEVDGKMQPGYRGTPEDPKGDGEIPAASWYAGKQYDDDIEGAKAILGNLDKYYPGAKGYEVVGFFWWQGDKDMRNPAHFERYELNLTNLFKSLRKEFDCPDSKFVTASLGQTKEGSASGDGKVLDAMKAVSKTKDPELKGDVAFVYTNPLSMGGSSSGHYNGNSETYMNVGEAMGRAMVELQAK